MTKLSLPISAKQTLSLLENYDKKDPTTDVVDNFENKCVDFTAIHILLQNVSSLS